MQLNSKSNQLNRENRVIPLWGYKKLANEVLRDIQQASGYEAEVDLIVGPEVKNKKLFSVALHIQGLPEPIAIKKMGKCVSKTLHKVRKVALRKIRRVNKKCLSENRHRLSQKSIRTKRKEASYA